MRNKLILVITFLNKCTDDNEGCWPYVGQNQNDTSSFIGVTIGWQVIINELKINMANHKSINIDNNKIEWESNVIIINNW